MRYKLTVWIGAAVLAVVCAHVVQTIDRDIQLPGQETTASTSNDDNVNVQNIEKITSEDKEGDREGTGNPLNPKPEEGGQGSNDVGGNVSGVGDNEIEEESREALTSNSKEIPPNSDEQEGSDNEGGEIGNIPKPDSSEVKPQSDELPMSRSEERVEPTTDIVQTDTGPVQGFYKNSDSKIRSYIDIPYGTFSDLFQAPVKSKSWITVHTVKEHEKRCPQIDEDDKFAGEIDCLTLSVFAPPDVENAPVLFHIYDGDFRTGSAYPSIYGPDYLVPKGIILVLPNYRVGPLGFLCMNNDVAQGNAALKDLTLALDWTKRNIERFGGNASRIVVSGYGKSGALAGYMAMSLKSRNYISGVITESGSVLAPWAIDRNPVDTVEKLTGVLEQNITAEIDLELLVTSAKNIDFMPCIENSTDGFMNETAWTILQDTNFGSLKIPFLIGSANHAGLHEATKHTTESLSQLNKNFSQILPNDLKFKNEKDKSEAADKLKKLYFNDDDITTGNIHNISLCYTDAHYLGPVLRESRDLVQAGATVYLYEFSFVGGLNRESAALITTVQGAARGDIIGYTFVQDDDMPQEGTDEEKMVTLITDLWVSFIRKGEPSASGVTWNKLEKTEEENEQWLSMGAKVEAQKSLHVGRLALWTQIYKDHYIERNLAHEIPSSLFVITAALWLSLTK